MSRNKPRPPIPSFPPVLQVPVLPIRRHHGPRPSPFVLLFFHPCIQLLAMWDQRCGVKSVSRTKTFTGMQSRNESRLNNALPMAQTSTRIPNYVITYLLFPFHVRLPVTLRSCRAPACRAVIHELGCSCFRSLVMHRRVLRLLISAGCRCCTTISHDLSLIPNPWPRAFLAPSLVESTTI